ncbi:MAG: hypothetical protein JJU28_03925 [Cyclobacteriaceae bacterium]|nr:hypothetical protein [Cyclobacteriaceae bacterium]
MHPYLTHLLADINAAFSRKSRNSEPKQESLDEYFRDIDRWISGDSEHRLSYYCGLDPNNFPPYEQFSEKEIRQICHAFEEMLASWGVSIDFPEELPWKNRYELTVSLLDRDFTPMNSGIYVFDFCTGYAPDCELGEYCKCLDIWKEE